jgi:hypothetical protein
MIIFLYSLYFFPYYVAVDGNIKDLVERNLRDQKVLFERNVIRGKKIYAVVEIIITFIFKPQLHQAKFVVSASKKI